MTQQQAFDKYKKAIADNPDAMNKIGEIEKVFVWYYAVK